MLKATIHTDLSAKFWEKDTTGIAAINIDRSYHKGVALSRGLKSKLDDELNIRINDSRLLAICIWKIIEGHCQDIDEIIMCADAPYDDVVFYLSQLIPKEHSIAFTPLTELRKKLGKKIKSLAHGPANSYRRRGLKPWKKGKQLNTVRLGYREIIELWNGLENKNR